MPPCVLPIRVLIVDQHEIMRAGIKLACRDREHLEVVGEANSLAEAHTIAIETAADVAVIDPDSGGMTGLDQLHQLHLALPKLKLLVFTANDGAEHAARIMQSGAAGYLIKQAGLEEMSLAIRAIHLGRIFISHTRHGSTAPISASLCRSDDRSLTDSDAKSLPQSQNLSVREREVLDMIADGMTNKQAAAKLFLSVKTVETYRSRIMKKHRLRDRAELVRFARERCEA